MASTQLPSLTIGELLKRYRLEAELKQKELAKLLGYSDTIVSRIETGIQQPQPEFIEQFIKVLELDEVHRAEFLTVYHRQIEGTASTLASDHLRHEDWGEAPDVSIFFGREVELAELSQWLMTERCRLIVVVGMGGIGKTTLVTRLAREVRGEFTSIIWRSLRNAPSVTEILIDCLNFLSGQQHTDWPHDPYRCLSMLIEIFRQKRCLVILDNAETLMQVREKAGQYREGYEAYRRLIQLVGETNHQSCLILTSREKPREVALLAGDTMPVRSLTLGGLGQAASRDLLDHRHLVGDEAAWIVLNQRYAGNPLALRQVSAAIEDLYGGEISTFLAEITAMFGEINYLLEQQFNRLSDLEQTVMYWLAINREPVSLQELREDLVQPTPTGELAEVMESLNRRSLIEKNTGRFTLQNVVMEYMTDRLVRLICEEIMMHRIILFQSLALIKATAKDYVRESQVRLILKPIIDKLSGDLKKDLRSQLSDIITMLRPTPALKSGYIIGNILNLLALSKNGFTGWDFSEMAVWQAYLLSVEMQRVNFAYSDFAKSIFMGVYGDVLSIAVDPTGKLLAAGTTDNNIRLWQLTDNTPSTMDEGHTGLIRTVAFSPNGKFLASGSDDHTIRLWDTPTRQSLFCFKGHTSAVRSIAFSTDGHRLISGSEDATIRIWNIDTGQCTNILRGHTDRVRSVTVSPDGLLVASGGEDQAIRLWDISSGKCLNVFYHDRDSGWVGAVAFHPDNSRLASCGSDQTIRMWDINTGECLKILQGHTDRVRALAFSSDRTRIASGGEDGTLRIWDVNTGQCLNILSAQRKWVNSVTFTPDGQGVAGSSSNTVQLWNVNSGECLKILQGYRNSVKAVAFSPGGQLIASGNEDRNVFLWRTDTWQYIKILRSDAGAVRSVAFSPDETMLVTAGRDYQLRVWEIETGQILKTLRGHTEGVHCVIFSPDGETIASASDDFTVRLWEIKSGLCLKVLDWHKDWVGAVAFSPDGQLLVSASEDTTIGVWDVKTRQLIRVLEGHTKPIWSVAFHPNGCLIASGSNDYTVRLWDIKTGECLKIFEGHTGRVRSITFSPDGYTLASSGSDYSIQLWETNTGLCMRKLVGHTGPIWSITMSPNGHILVSGSDDGTIKIWDTQSGHCLKTLRPDRPYERMNITGVTGLTEAQKASLKTLGAIEEGITL